MGSRRVGAASDGVPARSPLVRLWEYALPQRRPLAVGAALELVGGAAGLAQPLIARDVIDALGAGEPILGPVLILAAFVTGGAVAGALGAFVLERASQGMVLGVRRTLVGGLIRLRIAEVDRLKPGDLVARLTADTTLLRTVATSGLTTIATSGLLLVGGVMIMVFLDWRLFLVTAGMIVVVGLLMGVVLPRIETATRAAQAALGELGALLERTFGAFRTIKASSAEDAETARLEEAAVESWRKGVAVAGWSAVAGTATGLAVNITFLAILAVGGSRAAMGALDISSLIAFLLLLFYLMSPIRALVSSITELQAGLAAVRRIDEVAALEVEDTGNRAAPAARPSRPASVVFEDVVFRYGEDLPLVHRGVSFASAGTGLTALVGPSGAGKTTVFSLVERFYDAVSGRVLVDGVDVRDWPLEALRARIGYVEQDAPVLDGTLRENLLMAAPSATDTDLARVVGQARLGDLVKRLPQGLASRVGHRGVTLSGGERQRVAIARALLRKPRVLLMDEATSQLDAVNEGALREVVLSTAQHTNVIVVAHRLSTVTSADRIVVMDAGKVRAVGTHAELLTGDSLYRSLAAEQMLASGSL